jgi:hypothetical protein
MKMQPLSIGTRHRSKDNRKARNFAADSKLLATLFDTDMKRSLPATPKKRHCHIGVIAILNSVANQKKLGSYSWMRDRRIRTWPV